MNNDSNPWYYFNLGQYISQIMLKGIIHPDMHRRNIKNDGINFKFTDYADVDIKSIPDDLNEKTFHQLTVSLFPPLDPIVKDFTLISHFRAGFTSYGGILTHALFSNMANKGLSSFLYTPNAPYKSSYNAKPIYTNPSISKLINNWKNTNLDNVDIIHYNTYSAYQLSEERKWISSRNIYYLDNLYFVRLYFEFKNFGYTFLLPQIIRSMAVTAHQTGLFCTAYGLYEKLLTLENDTTYLNEFFNLLSKDLSVFSQAHPCIAEFIKTCTSLDLFEFMWILSDLETSIPDYSCMYASQKTLREHWHPHLSSIETELHV